jgi:hypothetical protein
MVRIRRRMKQIYGENMNSRIDWFITQLILIIYVTVLRIILALINLFRQHIPLHQFNVNIDNGSSGTEKRIV